MRKAHFQDPYGTINVVCTLTLGTNDNDRYVWTICTELAVELVKILETGFILQTKDEDHGINPAAELEEQKRQRFQLFVPNKWKT